MKTMGSDKKQIDKFKDAAKKLDCDDDENRFRERLGKIVKSDNTDPETKKPRQ